MPGLTMLADNPYLRGNPASALTPEQKRDGLLGQPWMAGVAPGLEANDKTQEGYEQHHGGRVENG